MNIDKVLHIVRNPSGFDADTIREARIRLADAYENAIKNYEIAMISLQLKVNQAQIKQYNQLLADLVDALDNAFISSRQSTSEWDKQLAAAREYIESTRALKEQENETRTNS